MGLGAKPPPQLGQTSCKTLSTQSLQKVHSNEQIIASVEEGSSGLLQFSHVGLSSSIFSVTFSFLLSEFVVEVVTVGLRCPRRT